MHEPCVKINCCFLILQYNSESMRRWSIGLYTKLNPRKRVTNGFQTSEPLVKARVETNLMRVY